MKVINYTDAIPVEMNNDMIKNVAGRLIIGKEDGAPNFCMRVFEIGKDGNTPRHAHDWEHEIFVHKGTGQVLIDNEWHCISEGSAIFIPANVEHQFKNESDDVFTFVCLIPSGAPEI